MLPTRRKSFRIPIVSGWTLLAIGALAQGQDSKPTTINVLVDTNRSFIAVTFSGGKPDAGKAVDSQEWRVVVIRHDPKSDPIRLSVQPQFYTRPNGTIDQVQVRLTPAGGQQIPKDVDLVLVQFDPQSAGVNGTWKARKESVAGEPKPAVTQNPDRIVAATSKQGAAVYFSGLYSPSIGSPPQYSVDAVVNPTFHLTTDNPCEPRLGFNAQVKTDKRATVDPDSYVVSPSFNTFVFGCGASDASRFSGRSVLLNWNVFGPEFEAKGKDLNLISAPMLSDSFRLWPFPSTPTTTKEFFTAYLSPTAGLEFGTNLKNGVEPNGSGTILRGVAGADLSARFLLPENFMKVKKVLLSSSYRARLPAFSEISTNTIMPAGSTKPKDIFTLSRSTRNHVQNELDFLFTDSWGITIKHEYGRIPPAFRLVDNTTSVGLVFMFSQAGSSKQKGQQ
jgi:hypothetical protein